MYRFSRWSQLAGAAFAAILTIGVTVRQVRAQAQATTGVIRGVVSDSAGGPIAGAVVTLRHTETNITRTLRTGERGDYAGTLLPLGTYEVTVRSIGFAGQTKRAVFRSQIIYS